MVRQPQKAVWSKRPYHRRSVERKVFRFMGWDRLLNIIRALEKEPTSFDDQLVFADYCAVAFATAGRISEVLKLKPENFIEREDHFEVVNMFVHKRYEKVAYQILCKRCKTLNEPFEVICRSCGANLVMGGGERKWITRPIKMFRKPFKIPKKEATTKFLIRRLQIAEENGYPYLFYNPYKKRPITDSCIYTHFTNVGKIVGIELWPHRLRAERCKQLVEEYGFTRDDLKEFTMIIAEKTLDVYAGTSVPYERKMGIKAL